MNIMCVHHLLVEHPFAAEFGQTCKAGRILAVFLRNFKEPDGKLVYEVKGIGVKTAESGFRSSWSL